VLVVSFSLFLFFSFPLLGYEVVSSNQRLVVSFPKSSM
jgi:hypothetical protein